MNAFHPRPHQRELSARVGCHRRALDAGVYAGEAAAVLARHERFRRHAELVNLRREIPCTRSTVDLRAVLHRLYRVRLHAMGWRPLTRVLGAAKYRSRPGAIP